MDQQNMDEKLTVFVWESNGKIDLSIYEYQNKDTRQGSILPESLQ